MQGSGNKIDLKNVKKLLSKYSKKDVEFGKLEDYILKRINVTKEEVIDDLFQLNNLKIIEKQEIKRGAICPVLYLLKKKGQSLCDKP